MELYSGRLADKGRTRLKLVLYSDMEVRSQKSYQDLKAAINRAVKDKANLLIVTLPGTGMGRFLKEYEAETDLEEKMTILNYDWEKVE